MWLSLGLRSTCGCNILAAEAVCCFPQSNTAWSRTTKTDRRQRGQSSQRKRFPGCVLATGLGPRHWYSGSAFQHRWIVYRALPVRQDLLCVRSWQERRTDVKHPSLAHKSSRSPPEKWSIIKCLSCVLNRELKRAIEDSFSVHWDFRITLRWGTFKNKTKQNKPLKRAAV